MSDADIEGMEAALRLAQLEGDVQALDRLIADDLLFTGPDGALATKAADVAAYRDGVMRVAAHEPESLHVRRLGDDIAVAALRTRMRGQYAGAPFDTVVCYTRVWARSGGEWKVVAGQVNVLSTPAPDAEAAGRGGG